MKTIKRMGRFIKLLPILSAVFIFSGCETENAIPETDLPAEASAFISTHFPGETIAQVIKEKEGLSVDYDVFLSNGIAMEFSKKGQCRSIEGGVELPDSVIPQGILDYVRQNYQGHQILQWELDRNEQEVEISNGLELKFDANGNFIRIDN